MTGLGHFVHDTWDDGADVVVIPNTQFFNFHPTDTTYSGVKFDADGGIYMRHQNGSWGKYGEWLVRGAASGMSITRVITSGTLTTDAGAGPLQMDTSRIYDVIDSDPFDGAKTAAVTFEITGDAAAGPTLLSFSAVIEDL